MRSPDPCRGHMWRCDPWSPSLLSAGIEPTKKVTSITPVHWVSLAGLQIRQVKEESCSRFCKHDTVVVVLFYYGCGGLLCTPGPTPHHTGLTSSSTVKSRVDCEEASFPLAFNSAERTRLQGRQH